MASEFHKGLPPRLLALRLFFGVLGFLGLGVQGLGSNALFSVGFRVLRFGVLGLFCVSFFGGFKCF